MKRGHILALSAIVLALMIVVLKQRFTVASLAPSVLALKPIEAPRRFAEDCSKVRLAEAKTKVRSISRSIEALTADEQAIYRAVLLDRSAEGALNVSSRTFPLDIIGSSNDVSDCECLEGMEAGAIVQAARSYHELAPDLLHDLKARFVSADRQADLVRINDPNNPANKSKSVDHAVRDAFATGLFSMSEIAFDRDRRHALVGFSFWCGGLCGSGSTLRFEKIEGKWKKVHTCGGWIS